MAHRGARAGDGERGCSPRLQSLVLAEGSLEPAFSPEVSSYRVRLPAARESLQLVATAAAGAAIEIEGAKLSSDGVWTSPRLSMDEHTFGVLVIAPTGLVTKYTLVVVP